MPQLLDAIGEQEEGRDSDSGTDTKEDAKEDALSEEEQSCPDPYDTEMAQSLIDGYYYIGYLSVPKLGLELPVMASWSYPQLRISPCRYGGSVNSNDLVIMAHNYASHFGGLSGLSLGDVVAFTDMNGIRTAYEVVALDVLVPAAVEEMIAGEYDMTLFTCTYGGKSRVTVRCMRTN